MGSVHGGADTSAPDIVEAILTGEEPSGLWLTMLTKRSPTAWEEQLGEMERLRCDGILLIETILCPPIVYPPSFRESGFPK